MHPLIAPLALLLATSQPEPPAAPPVASHGGPVIDMHLHAFAMDELPPGTPACPGDQTVRVATIDPGEALDSRPSSPASDRSSRRPTAMRCVTARLPNCAGTMSVGR